MAHLCNVSDFREDLANHCFSGSQVACHSWKGRLFRGVSLVDGYHRPAVARACQERLLLEVLDARKNTTQEMLKTGFRNMQDRMRLINYPTWTKLPRRTVKFSGCSATVLLFEKGKNQFTIANAGNNVVLLVRSNGIPVLANPNHEWSNREERNRFKEGLSSIGMDKCPDFLEWKDMLKKRNNNQKTSHSNCDYDDEEQHEWVFRTRGLGNFWSILPTPEGKETTRQLVSPEPEIQVLSTKCIRKGMIVVLTRSVFDYIGCRGVLNCIKNAKGNSNLAQKMVTMALKKADPEEEQEAMSAVVIDVEHFLHKDLPHLTLPREKVFYGKTVGKRVVDTYLFFEDFLESFADLPRYILESDFSESNVQKIKTLSETSNPSQERNDCFVQTDSVIKLEASSQTLIPERVDSCVQFEQILENAKFTQTEKGTEDKFTQTTEDWLAKKRRVSEEDSPSMEWKEVKKRNLSVASTFVSDCPSVPFLTSPPEINPSYDPFDENAKTEYIQEYFNKNNEEMYSIQKQVRSPSNISGCGKGESNDGSVSMAPIKPRSPLAGETEKATAQLEEMLNQDTQSPIGQISSDMTNFVHLNTLEQGAGPSGEEEGKLHFPVPRKKRRGRKKNKRFVLNKQKVELRGTVKRIQTPKAPVRNQRIFKVWVPNLETKETSLLPNSYCIRSTLGEVDLSFLTDDFFNEAMKLKPTENFEQDILPISLDFAAYLGQINLTVENEERKIGISEHEAKVIEPDVVKQDGTNEITEGIIQNAVAPNITEDGTTKTPSNIRQNGTNEIATAVLEDETNAIIPDMKQDAITTGAKEDETNKIATDIIEDEPNASFATGIKENGKEPITTCTIESKTNEIATIVIEGETNAKTLDIKQNGTSNIAPADIKENETIVRKATVSKLKERLRAVPQIEKVTKVIRRRIQKGGYSQILKEEKENEVVRKVEEDMASVLSEVKKRRRVVRRRRSETVVRAANED